MRKLLTIVAALAMCALPLSVWSEEQQSEERDVLEVNIQGGLSLPMGAVKTWHDSLGAKTGFNGGIHFGYFFGPKLVGGITFTYSQFGIDTPDKSLAQHHRLYSPALYVKYHFFSGGNLVPFLEANVGADFVKFASLVSDKGSLKYRELGYAPAAAVGISCGAFYYTSDYGGLFLQAGYHHGFTEKAKKTYQGTDYEFGKNLDALTLNLGIQVFFEGK